MILLRVKMNPEVQLITPSTDVAWRVAKELMRQGRQFTMENTSIDGDVSCGAVYVARSNGFCVIYDVEAPVGPLVTLMFDLIQVAERPAHEEVLRWVRFFDPPTAPEEEEA